MNQGICHYFISNCDSIIFYDCLICCFSKYVFFILQDFSSKDNANREKYKEFTLLHPYLTRWRKSAATSLRK